MQENNQGENPQQPNSANQPQREGVKPNPQNKNPQHGQNRGQKKPQGSQQKKRRGPPKFSAKLGNQQWELDMKEAIKSNKLVHSRSLQSYNKINTNTDASVKITPLGGLGEIGGNFMIMETNTSAIIIDIGMSFPSEDMHGVDILIPDFSYIRKLKDKEVNIIITHGHEDHIGAVAYFFKKFQFPIYGTPLPLGMLSNKFDEHGLKKEKRFFRPIEKRKVYKIGDFEIEWMHVTHSIIDASSLAITTDAGTIIHTGDFKIDHTPIDGYPTDIHRFAHYGEKGVLCLLSDSTNSYRDGITKSESSVGPTFDRIFKDAKGRVIMSTFSSNIHRVYQAIEHGIKHNRKICVIGRSMERNLEIAMELGYVKLDRRIFIDPNEVNKYNDKEVLIVTTGSQGETMSALFRMATDEHRHIKIKPSDQIIISAKAIPGNEASVSRVLNYLIKAGAKVAYQDFSEIHVSGHAAMEEQKLMLRLCKPKFFLPVHGEYNHIHKHKQTGIACGVNPKNILLMSDGDQIEVSPKYLKKVGTVKAGKTYIDNQINKQIDDDVVNDRQNLAEAGVVMIIAQIDQQTKKLISKPIVKTYGIVADRRDKAFSQEMEEILDQFLINAKPQMFEDQKGIENAIRQVIRKHIFRQMKKYPTIVPTIFIM
ncbi:MAG: RNase J family beta-CASP ribonuclease [Epsilonproteobacteria bacterium]|nr:RNase J family beta-CASP ribonuclease [Campylobacterota bacterium]